MQAIRVGHLPELPPFIGGAVGYAGYDTVRYVEHLPNAPPDDRGLPDLAFAFYDHMVVFDNVNKTIVVVAMARLDRPTATTSARPTPTLHAASTSWSSALERPTRSLPPADIDAGGEPHARLPLELHAGRVRGRPSRKCVEYIRAGDIFQVVLSQRLAVDAHAPTVRDLPHAAGREPQPVHVLPADAAA